MERRNRKGKRCGREELKSEKIDEIQDSKDYGKKELENKEIERF